jgi:Nitrile hydratase beta subunit, N-terminal
VGALAHRAGLERRSREGEDQLHRRIPPRARGSGTVYNSLTYFELWTQGFINLMEEKGVLTRAEVETRAAEIRDRLKRIA